MMTAIRKALECSIVAVASVAAFLLAGCEPAALDGPVAGKGAVIVSLASPATKGQSVPDYFLPSETRLDAIGLLAYQNGEKVYGERYASTNGGTLTVTLDPKSFDTYAALKAQAITLQDTPRRRPLYGLRLGDIPLLPHYYRQPPGGLDL